MDTAVTGIGIVSPLGVGREAFWENCRAARSGLKRIPTFDATSLTSDVAGVVEDFDPSLFMPARAYRRMSRISRMAVAASVEALQDSGVEPGKIHGERVAVVMGTAYGSSSHVEDFFVSLMKDGPRGAQPLLFPETVPNAPASHIAMFHGFTGPNTTFCQNNISAENALLFGMSLLELGRADMVLAGGAEELSEMLFACHDAVGALNPVRAGEGPTPEPRPGRGLVLGEGAAVLVLEPLSRALKRGASLYGILRAGAISGGASHLGGYEEEAKGLARAVTEALGRAGIGPDEIDQIHVSADFSGAAERVEQLALRNLLGEGADERGVTPLKYLTGDFGGAGALRAACLLLALSRKQSPPTVRIGDLSAATPAPPCWAVDAGGRFGNGLMTSTTFGGGSASLLFSRFEDP